MHPRIICASILALGLLAIGPAAGAQPANDNFEHAVLVSSVPFADHVDTTTATTQPGEPKPSCGSRGDDHTVWYEYTAPADGAISVDTFASDYDTALAVYTSIEPFGLSEVACNDDFQGSQSRVGVRVLAGRTYHVQAAGWAGQSGVLVLHAEELPVTASDDRASATEIPGLPFADSTSTLGATSEADEPQPNCGYKIGATVWYRYTAPADARIYVDTFGSDFDTIIGVYRQNAAGSLMRVVCNDDAGSLQSQAIVDVVAAGTYLVQVGGFDGETGSLKVYVGTEPRCVTGTIENGPVTAPVHEVVEPLTGEARPIVHDLSCLANDITGL